MGAKTVSVPQVLFEELLGVANSINHGQGHRVEVDGEDTPCYWQRGEWVQWALEVAASGNRCLAEAKATQESKQKRTAAVAQDETLAERLERLEGLLSQVESTGMDGDLFSQRICGDLLRIMNTAWLNCFDFIHRYERQQEEAMPASAKAAMEYAATADEGQAFLQRWMAGDYETIRKEWPDAPDVIYVTKNIN